MHGIGDPNDKGSEDPDIQDNPLRDPFGFLRPPPHQCVEGLYGDSLKNRDVSVSYAASPLKIS